MKYKARHRLRREAKFCVVFLLDTVVRLKRPLRAFVDQLTPNVRVHGRRLFQRSVEVIRIPGIKQKHSFS